RLEHGFAQAAVQHDRALADALELPAQDGDRDAWVGAMMLDRLLAQPAHGLVALKARDRAAHRHRRGGARRLAAAPAELWNVPGIGRELQAVRAAVGISELVGNEVPHRGE